MKRKRKGQMEILGLAVLFVIVIIGFMLFLKFGMKPTRTPFEDYYHKTLPNDMLNTIMTTSVECDGREYSFIDVAKDYKSTYRGNIYCSTLRMNSEQLLGNISKKVVGSTMEELGRRYWVAIWDDRVLNEYGLVDPTKIEEDYNFKYLSRSDRCNMFDNNQNPAKVNLQTGQTTIFVGIGVCRG